MNQASQTKAGILFAVAAYTMWGIAPIYFKALTYVPAAEILMHRVIWSVVVLVILIVGLKHLGKVRAALKSRRVIGTLLLAGFLLAGNWLLFIWSVNNNYLLEASLGYFINPLINVFLGRIFLGEQLRPIQKLAVGIAMVGVGLLVVSYGQPPWIALTLACSFSVYGLLRKQVAVDSMPGLFVETSMMLPVALVYYAFFATQTADLTANSAQLNTLLLFAGIVTTAPLLCFTAAARRIQYSTLGMIQYIGPSIMFVLAIVIYKESLSQARLTTFVMVWTALAIFTYDSVRHFHKNRPRKSTTRPV
ncbi:EamA family transporter RarD [Glaciecola sp. XM2]|uniref:EamA family transporter RarD n=1 Tax=Glaciecola sp. XM2 TaxID=1914931 RepID=UPI001BDDDE9E|nr:EamA family transporter RarD [Glaciecola sp. XM2]